MDKHYVGFVLLQNTKFTVKDSIKVRKKMLTESCVISFCCSEPFKASFSEIVYRPLGREKEGRTRREAPSRRPRPCPVQARIDAKPSKFSPRKHRHSID